MHVILLATAGHWIGILFKWKWKQWTRRRRGGVVRYASGTMAFLSAGEIALLLWSDVGGSRAETSAGFGHFVLIHVLKWEMERSRNYWFLKHGLSHSAHCPLPRETLPSILLDLPSHLLHSDMQPPPLPPLLTGNWEPFSIKRKHLFPFDHSFYISAKHFRAKQCLYLLS